ncbi:hypothetical protein PsorP6_009193 [Peronosclerospora sorghi]|uniref:Uncharacterized protein n=1 Tax=Peronosclerospora sorghi TaxID=230839 RepID=A0ACC0W3C3_9STRA|nr:hypothetical protein PsorP6_009193 [Peronosclerospora sorghi]
MLRILRVLYGRLCGKLDSIHAILDAVVRNETARDGKLVRTYLETHRVTITDLVSRPMNRFDECIQFVEELRTTVFEEVSEEDGLRHGNDRGTKQTFRSIAQQLEQIARENKDYVERALAEAREENEVIALQKACVDRGESEDWSTKKLLLHGELLVSMANAQSECMQVTQDARTCPTLLSQLETSYAHCFDDGALILSTRECTGFETSYQLLDRIELKHDAVFLETVPTSVLECNAFQETRAFVLIKSDSTVVFAWRDAEKSQRWTEVMRGFLEMNGTRADVFHEGRPLVEVPQSVESAAQVAETDKVPTTFVSFYDDYLPDVFWLAPRTDRDQWELVEIVCYARWLVVYKLHGWKKHATWCSLDTKAHDMHVREQVHGEKEWSLLIQYGSQDNFTLVSTKRS